MFIKLMAMLLVILVILLFLIFFKSWHLYIIFENNDLNFNYFININFLIFNIIILNELSQIIKLEINIFSKKITIFKYTFSNNKTNTIEDDQTRKEDILIKFKRLYPLLKRSEEDLFLLIKLTSKIISFDDSIATIKIGLIDNNLTIKFCTMLWALSAPLYPLGFKVIVTHEVNKLILKSDVNIKFQLYLFQVLKIILFIIKRKNLRDIIRLIQTG